MGTVASPAEHGDKAATEDGSPDEVANEGACRVHTDGHSCKSAANDFAPDRTNIKDNIFVTTYIKTASGN